MFNGFFINLKFSFYDLGKLFGLRGGSVVVLWFFFFAHVYGMHMYMHVCVYTHVKAQS